METVPQESAETSSPSAKIKLLFLEMMGVLNWKDYIIREAKRGELAINIVDPVCVARLTTICAVSGAKVVLTSEWRNVMDFDKLVAFLEFKGFKGELIGATPEVYGTTDKGDEISAFLDQYGEPVEKFCILDTSACVGLLVPYLVITSFEKGLLDEHVTKALALLGSM